MKWLDPSALIPKDPKAHRELRWLVVAGTVIIIGALASGQYLPAAVDIGATLVIVLAIMGHKAFFTAMDRVDAAAIEYRRRALRRLRMRR